MNYTASVTLTGVDNLSKILGNATTALDRLRLTATNAGQKMTVLGMQFGVMQQQASQVAALNTQISNMAKSIQSLNTSGANLNQLATGLRNVNSAVGSSGRGAFNTTNVHAFTDAVTGAMRGLSLFYVRARNISNLFLNGLGLRAAAQEALEFNSAVEVSRLSIAASLLTFKSYKDAQGNSLAGDRAYVAALKDAGSAQDILRAKVFDTTATFSELVVAYQKIVAAAGKTTATEKDFADLTTSMSIMAKSWNMDLNTVSTQFQSVLLGVSRVNSRVGGFLRGLGVTPDTLKSWRQQGIAVQELNKLLIQYNAIGGDINKTWPGILSNLEDGFQNLFGEGFRSAIRATGTAISEFTAQLIDIGQTRKTGKIQIDQSALADVRAISDGIASIVDAAGKMSPLVVGLIGTIGVAFVEAAKPIGDIIGLIAKFTNTISSILGEKTISIIKGLASSFAAVAIQVGVTIGIFFLLQKAITQVTAAYQQMLATASLVPAANAAAGAGMLANFNAIGGIIGIVGAKLLSFASIAAVVAGVGVILGNAISIAGEKLIDYTTNTDLARQSSEDNLTAITAVRVGVIGATHASVSAAQAQELLTMGYQKAVLVKRNLIDADHDGLFSTKEFTAAIAEANRTILESVPATDAAIKQYTALFDEMVIARDKTGKKAITVPIDRQMEELRSKLADLDEGTNEYIVTEASLDLLIQKKTRDLAKHNEELAKTIGLNRDFVQSMERFATVSPLGKNFDNGEFDIFVDKDQDKRAEAFRKRVDDYEKLMARMGKIASVSSVDRIEAERRVEHATVTALENETIAKNKDRLTEAQLAEARKKFAEEHVEIDQRAYDKVQQHRADLVKQSKRDAQTMYLSAVTTTEGIAAAWAILYSTLKTKGQVAADLMIEQFNLVANALDDTFSKALTGQFDDIASSFKNMTDGFAKSWSHAITDVVKNWLTGADQIVAAGQEITTFGSGPNGEVTSQTYTAGQRLPAGTIPSTGQYVNKYLNGAAQGYAVGSGVGSASGAPGFSTGATIGGTVGGVIGTAAISGSSGGPWGALIGAIIGGIVGILSAPNTENHLFLGPGGKSYTGTGYANTSSYYNNFQPSPVEGSIRDTGNAMSAGLADAFKASGSSLVWKDWVKSVNQVITDYIQGIKFEIHAGSDEDMKKDMEYLLKGIIPREMLYNLFGVGKILSPNNVAGISGAGAYDPNRGDYNKDAPLYALFSSLGFSAEKIKEIANQIGSTDPEVFLTRVKSLLGVVGNINRLVTNFGGGKNGILSEINTRASATQGELFSKSADAIITLFDQLGAYSGEEQLKKAEEANQAANQYWEDQIATIQKIQTLARDITASIGAQIAAMSNARLGKDAGWLNSDRRARLDQILPNSPDWGIRMSGELGGATDPAKIGALASEAQALIAAIFDDLNQKLTKARDLQAQVASGFGELAVRMGDAIAGKGADWITADKRRRIAEIGGLISGTNDPTALGNLAAEAKQLISDVFGTLEDSLKNIRSIAEQFATSIASQLASMKEGRLGKNTRSQNYARLDQIIPLSPFELDNPGLLGSTTDPAQLQKLGKEAQDLIAAIFSDLLAQLQRASALKSDFTGLLEKFTGVFDSSPTGMSGYLERVGKLQADVAHAATLSGTEQLDALDKVKESALALYDEQAKMLEAIKTNMADLTSSIDKQISDITDQFSSSAEGQGLQETIRQLNQIKFAGGKLTDSQQQQYDSATNQLGNVMREEGAKKAWDEIQRLKASIGTASSPEEVKRITEEIQQQSSKYLGFFREDDPRRQEASSRIVGELQATKELATAAYKEMEAQIKAANEAIKTALTSATTLLTNSMTATQAEMAKLESILVRVGDILKDQFAAAAAAVVTQMVALKLIMDALGKQIDKQFTAIIVTTQKEIEKLEGYLKLLNATVSEKLNATIDSLVAKNIELAAAIDLAKKAFTEVTTALNGGGGGGGGGGKGEGAGGEGGSGGGKDIPNANTLVSSFKSITTSGNDVVTVIDSLALSGRALIGVIDNITKGLGGTPPTSNSGGGGTKGTSDVVSYIKNNPSVLNTRTR